MLTWLQQLPLKLDRADRPADIDSDLLLLLLGGVWTPVPCLVLLGCQVQCCRFL